MAKVKHFESQVPTYYSPIQKNHSFTEYTNYKGKKYELLRTFEKTYSVSQRLWLGVKVFAKTFFSLGLGLISANLREDWKALKTGKRDVIIYGSEDLALKILAQNGNIQASTQLIQSLIEKKSYAEAYIQLTNLINNPRLENSVALEEVYYYLGILEDKGLGCQINKEQAFAHYAKALEYGHLKANVNLGLLYQKGEGCEVDLKKAFECFKKGANHHDPESLYYLANLYESGQGTKQNIEKTLHFYDLAASQGHLQANLKLDQHLEKQLNAINNFIENKQLNQAFNDLKLAAMNSKLENSPSFAKVHYYLGLVYEKGLGVGQDYKKALEHYKKATDKGETKAYYRSALLYQNGQGCKKDLGKAFRHLHLAANREHAKACYLIAQMYEKGEGVEQHMPNASHYYQLAANHGHQKAKAKVNALQKSYPS